MHAESKIAFQTDLPGYAFSQRFTLAKYDGQAGNIQCNSTKHTADNILARMDKLRRLANQHRQNDPVKRQISFGF